MVDSFVLICTRRIEGVADEQGRSCELVCQRFSSWTRCDDIIKGKTELGCSKTPGDQDDLAGRDQVLLD